MRRTARSLIAAAAVLLAGAAGAQDDIPVDLQIIGFGVSDEVAAGLEAAATAGGGRYYSAGDEEQLTEALGEATGLGTGDQAGDPAERQAVTLVMDVSNSMWGQIGGRSKIDIAREAIAQLLTGWDAGADLGLVAAVRSEWSPGSETPPVSQAYRGAGESSR